MAAAVVRVCFRAPPLALFSAPRRPIAPGPGRQQRPPETPVTWLGAARLFFAPLWASRNLAGRPKQPEGPADPLARAAQTGSLRTGPENCNLLMES